MKEAARISSQRCESFKQIPWVQGRSAGYYFAAKPLVINASPDAVWQAVKNVSDYSQYSNGALTASLNQGVLSVNNYIHLVLYANQAIGKFIPASDERISVVDDEHHVLAWERNLPLKSGFSECYRVLEPIDDGRATRSHVALKIPGMAGFFTHLFYKKEIENAFDRVNEGIKVAIEKKI
ncbi:MAG TPA: SRPBCC family protein [Gammaproteobacteria bacterium]|jgi:hypothetical protein|nr:SRPBCC family protein [Gammaproteobacteria bacterium]